MVTSWNLLDGERLTLFITVPANGAGVNGERIRFAVYVAYDC